MPTQPREQKKKEDGSKKVTGLLGQKKGHREKKEHKFTTEGVPLSRRQGLLSLQAGEGEGGTAARWTTLKMQAENAKVASITLVFLEQWRPVHMQRG